MRKLSYNESSFWEEKYKANCCEQLQWICKPQFVFTSIPEFLNYQEMQHVLQIGCGTSNFSIKLKRQIQSRQHQAEITCIDFSKQLIKKMRSSKGISGVSYVAADVKNMSTVLNQQFDYIFDKGTIDCLFCSDSFIKEVILGLRQCFKLLKPGGKLIVVSHGKQKHRYYLLRNKLLPFKVQQKTIPKSRDQPQVNFYICQKPVPGDQANDEEGAVDPQYQNEEEDTKNDKIKKEQQNKKKGDFILDDKSKKPKNGGDFILGQDQNKKDIPTSFILEQKGKKKQSKEQANFILKDDEEEEEEQENENDGQPENAEGEQQKQEQQKNNQEREKQDEANFILKQAEYQNQFEDG